MKNILFIVGSFRKNSFNHQLAKYVEEQLAGKANVSYLNFENIPYINQDHEDPVLPEIQQVRDEVMKADALWIFTPEYNSFIPGALKNLLDWLSRKLTKDSSWNETAIVNKPVTFSGAAGNSGSAKAQAHLGELLSFILTKPMKEPTTKVKIKSENFKDDVLTLSDEEKEMVDTQIGAFLQFIEEQN